MSTEAKTTLVKGAIQNPADGRHFMRIKPRINMVTATAPDGTVLAKSNQAVLVLEAGKDLYDPIYYFPREDVAQKALQPIDQSTHCPIKGDTEYYNVRFGRQNLEAAAWSYVKPFDFSMELKDRVAFDPVRIQIVEHIATPAKS
jgi:uncharacterized protein (DUF427 family)